MRSSAFATVNLPTAGEPWMKSSFMRSGLSIGDGPRVALRATRATKAATTSWHCQLPRRQSPERGLDRLELGDYLRRHQIVQRCRDRQADDGRYNHVLRRQRQQYPAQRAPSYLLRPGYGEGGVFAFNCAHAI